MKTERIDILDIEAGDRLRAVDPAKVSALKASIAEIGLRTPLTVSATLVDGEWHNRLVAGAHRLEALRQLGEEFADCFVMEGDEDDAALWEIDENFARAELSDAQRADHHVRREEILKRKGLVASGGQGGDRRSNDKKSLVRSYAVQASETLGVNKRTVERDLSRGKNITPDVLAEVSGTTLDKGVVLDELARTAPDEQRAKLAEITERGPSPRTGGLSSALIAFFHRHPEKRREFGINAEEPGAVLLKDVIREWSAVRACLKDIAPEGVAKVDAALGYRP